MALMAVSKEKDINEFDKKDDTNTTQLKELTTQLNSTSTEPRFVDSSHYLLNAFDIYKEQDITTQIMPPILNSDKIDSFAPNDAFMGFNTFNRKCELSKCPSLKHITDILHSNRKTFHDKYSNADLLNDYNHIVMKHYTEFEDIHNILIGDCINSNRCSLNTCLMMKRNNRDRSQSIENEQTLKQLYASEDDNDIVKQQFIDRIHSYYFHSFDTRYKFTRRQRQQLLDPDMKIQPMDNDCVDVNVSQINNMITSKHSEYKDSEALSTTNNTNKFITDTKQMSYSYGYRYFYWDYYKDNTSIHDDVHLFASVNEAPPANEGYTVGDWFIEKKYESLKQELLLNEIYVISEQQWNILMIKADVLMATDKAREIKCPRTESLKYYDITVYPLPILQQHMIAMLTYCNFSELQFKFSATFRRNNADETAQALKNRHRNYYFLGKLLRECTECFGFDTTTRNIEEINVYHGVNQYFLFSTLFAYIKGPFSTTIDYAVAANFCANKGLILNMKVNVGEWVYSYHEGRSNTRLSCFDVSWISDFTNEQEIFFIGGMGKFEFCTVIDPRNGLNYEKYIKGLKHMSCCMSIGDRTFSSEIPRTDDEMQMVYRLLSHELWSHSPDDKQAIEFKNCPDYIKKLLHLHAMSITKFGYYRWISEDSKIHAWLFEYDNGWIKIDLIMRIFPNIEQIAFDATEKDMQFLQQKCIYQSVLLFLNGNNSSRLKEIELKIKEVYVDKISECIDLYKEAFNEHSWSIGIRKNRFEMKTGPKKETIENVGQDGFAEEFLFGTNMDGLFDIDLSHHTEKVEYEKFVEDQTFIVMKPLS